MQASAATTGTPAPAWLAAARAHAQRAPVAARDVLIVQGYVVGSVERVVLEQIVQSGLIDPVFAALRRADDGWHLRSIQGDATEAMNMLAAALRRTGMCGPWRNEQLLVLDPTGERVGTVERGAVRPLGIATCAVHLIGTAQDGRMWVQQRAFNKANNPGMWDTLMGGMVSAADSLKQALERETWEEAGLRMADLRDLRHGGHVDFAQPAEEENNAGYMRERIDWFAATVPADIKPVNQDGEVERFELWTTAVVQEHLARGEFTPEAALLLADYFGW
ncbi:NUDIX domain-containing protein [Diaphorobacter sp. HDW4A]|uniref:NUDIX hydrolase n=1 Tax=Diaphorobacter sp. HDW4A TaxID=2714924 RepID=UPI00140A596D|nr:NUDIX domain-containing protein [Diaphorobacter sp. HDW4A]QIL81592.1 NUDIX domain-containing protein [Diaphorobacter sp. HDW4A]